MEYLSPKDIINADGLRLVLVHHMPSPWGQATKAMMDYKGLAFAAAPWEGGGDNPERATTAHPSLPGMTKSPSTAGTTFSSYSNASHRKKPYCPMIGLNALWCSASATKFAAS